VWPEKLSVPYNPQGANEFVNEGYPKYRVTRCTLNPSQARYLRNRLHTYERLDNSTTVFFAWNRLRVSLSARQCWRTKINFDPTRVAGQPLSYVRPPLARLRRLNFIVGRGCTSR
jgi:hypothetical protein